MIRPNVCHKGFSLIIHVNLRPIAACAVYLHNISVSWRDRKHQNRPVTKLSLYGQVVVMKGWLWSHEWSFRLIGAHTDCTSCFMACWRLTQEVVIFMSSGLYCDHACEVSGHVQESYTALSLSFMLNAKMANGQNAAGHHGHTLILLQKILILFFQNRLEYTSAKFEICVSYPVGQVGFWKCEISGKMTKKCQNGQTAKRLRPPRPRTFGKHFNYFCSSPPAVNVGQIWEL